jgi:hypothetical protein
MAVRKSTRRFIRRTPPRRQTEFLREAYQDIRDEAQVLLVGDTDGFASLVERYVGTDLVRCGDSVETIAGILEAHRKTGRWRDWFTLPRLVDLCEDRLRALK